MGNSEVLNHFPEQPLEKTEADLFKAVNEALEESSAIRKQYSDALDAVRNLFGLTELDYSELVEKTIQTLEKDHVRA